MLSQKPHALHLQSLQWLSLDAALQNVWQSAYEVSSGWSDWHSPEAAACTTPVDAPDAGHHRQPLHCGARGNVSNDHGLGV